MHIQVHPPPYSSLTLALYVSISHSVETARNEGQDRFQPFHTSNHPEMSGLFASLLKVFGRDTDKQQNIDNSNNIEEISKQEGKDETGDNKIKSDRLTLEEDWLTGESLINT